MPSAQPLVRDTGEFDLLRSLLPTFAQGPEVRLGPGDDAAVLDAVPPVLLCTDVLTEDVHFRRDWSSPHDVGRKAVAVNAADIAAMGGRTRALSVGLVLPADTEVAWVEQLASGMQVEAQAAGCSIVGGDTVSGPAVVISVTALGGLDGPLVTRSGAQPGDVVAVSGRLGYAAAGLDVLRRGFRSPRALVDAHRFPQPPYDDGPAAAHGGATAMIDISDGLLADVGHLASASGVGIVIDANVVGVDEALAAMGRGLGVDPLEWVLTGGEDHALAATFPATVALPGGFRAVGEVTTGSGVEVNGFEPVGGHPGYEHFSG
jgi:thiamine-monophosphate kinase